MSGNVTIFNHYFSSCLQLADDEFERNYALFQRNYY